MLALLVSGVLIRSGFDTLISLEEKDARIMDVLDKIANESHVHIELGAEAATLKLNVFVDKMPARDLLTKIGSVIDFDAKFDEERCSLKMPGNKLMDLRQYVTREQGEWAAPAIAKLEALASLTAYRFGETPNAPSEKPENETPLQWAQRKAVQPSFYAAGLWWKLVQRSGIPQSSLVGLPSVFCVDVGDRAPVRPGPRPCIGIDENSLPIRGTTVMIYIAQTTGELRVAGVNCDSDEDPLSERFFLHARPTERLAKEPFAKRLLAWDTQTAGVPASLLQKDTKAVDLPPDPGYFGGRISLTEKLDYLHRATGIPVISTSFRVPALVQDYSRTQAIEGMLKTLSSQERVFMRYEDGVLLVRHPAYWLFPSSEPDEKVIRAVEAASKSRTLTIWDYADAAFAVELGRERVAPWYRVRPARVATGLDVHERLPDARGLLFRFDPDPLVRFLPALSFLSSLTTTERQALLSGQPVGDLGLAKRSSSFFDIAVNGDGAADAAANLAPLFRSSISDGYVTAAERAGFPWPMPHPWGWRASVAWLAPSEDGHFHICFGFPRDPIATFDVELPSAKLERNLTRPAAY